MSYEIVKSAGGVKESAEKCEVLIESADDLTALPAALAVGSVAYTASLSAIYIKNINGVWTKVGG